MNKPIMIPKSELKAIALFVSRDSSRPILNGVCLEVSKRGVVLVATDGRKLGALKVSCTQDMEGLQDGEHVIPKELLKRAVHGSKGDVSITVDGREVTIGDDGFKCSSKLVDGSFPNWRQVVPNRKSEPVSRSSFNSALMMPFCDASKLLGKNGNIRLSFGGDERAAILIRIPQLNDFIGVQMPLVDNDGETPNPGWSILETK